MATQFINCRQCINGKLVSSPLTIASNGLVIPSDALSPDTETIDLKNAIIAPGFIELQINGALGFHFAHASTPEIYSAGVRKLAHYLPRTGVTGFFPTVPTVSSEVFKQVLPHLGRHEEVGAASVLGAHVEGPFLAPSKKGAHDATNMFVPETKSLEDVYGEANLSRCVSVCTIAPELPGALEHIKRLKEKYNVSVSMGHSAASHEEGVEGMRAGANLITHTFNAMNSLHHREPGLPGLISLPSPPYFSLIADSIHLHPRVVALAYNTSPSTCILITDSIELSGLPDGLYPGHAQIPFSQLKTGNKVTIQNTDTLIGTCIGLDECVRNLMSWANIPVEKAVMCVTENVAKAVGLNERGVLEVGRKGDFVVLSERGEVRETWIWGRRVWDGKGEGEGRGKGVVVV